MRTQLRLVLGTGVLAAAARVVEHPWRGPAAGQRIMQGCQRHGAVEGRGHRPANDAPGGEIHHRRQVQPALVGGHGGEITHPHLVGSGGGELPGQHVGGHRQGMPGIRGRPVAPAVLGLQAGLAHDARHAMPPAGFPLTVPCYLAPFTFDTSTVPSTKYINATANITV